MIIGYTAGIYDLFHVGHLRALKCAKALCDRLIVGVITDELAMEYKGKKPIIPFQQRIEIIRSLRCVDATVECKTRDFYKQWKLLKYDVAFSGENWCDDVLYMGWENELKKHGVIVKYIPRTSENSTSDIRRLIKEAK